tara:strand:- start:943 stop:1785 length:843 start_codon:yes stop_codon:yes gene_type:complete
MSDSEIIYNVHNKNNKLVTKSFINKILSNFGIKKKVRNLDIWRRAFIHKSYCTHRKKVFKNEAFDVPADGYEYIPLQKKSCETLEWLGDGIIQSITAQYLWKRYPDQNEGFLTKTRSKLVRTETLARFSRYLKLKKYILLSQYMENICNARDNPKSLEDAFEAFIGAMSEDLGDSPSQSYKICYKFFVTIIERVIDFGVLIMKDENYKDQLMRFYHQKFNGTNPTYESLLIDSSKKIKIYTEVVRHLDNRSIIIGKGTARSKKEAQQSAAKAALKYHKVL